MTARLFSVAVALACFSAGALVSHLVAVQMPFGVPGRAHERGIGGLAFSHDSTKLVSVSGEIVKVWRVKDLEHLKTFRLDGYGGVPGFLPGDNNKFVIATGRPKTDWAVVRCDIATGEQKQLLPYTWGRCRDLWPAEKTLVLTSEIDNADGHYFNFVDFEKRTERVVRLKEAFHLLSFSHDHMTAVLLTGKATVSLFDFGQKKSIRSFDIAKQCEHALLSPDKATLITLHRGQNRKAFFWDVDKGKLKDVRSVGPTTTDGLAMSPDGKMMGVRGRSSVQLYDLAKGELTSELSIGGLSESSCCQFSPDGRWLAVGEGSGHLWLCTIPEPE